MLCFLFWKGQGKKVTTGEVNEKFVLLARTHFIQRCEEVKEEEEESKVKAVPTLTISEEQLYLVPDISSKSHKNVAIFFIG